MMPRDISHLEPEQAAALSEAVRARRKALLYRGAGLGFLLLLPLLPGFRSEYWAFTLGWGACFGLVGLSINILTGYAGQISLAQAVLMGTGAFALGNLYALNSVPFLIAIPLAGLITSAVALMIGFPALRIRGLNLAIVTLVFQFLMNRVVFRLGALTGGSAGIDVERPSVFGTHLHMHYQFLYMIILCGVVLWWLDRNLVKTKAGRAFFALRADEQVASSFGIPVDRYKLLAFALSGFYAGVAGGLFGTLLGDVTAELFDYERSLEFLVFGAIGGLGSRAGVFVGSLFPVIFRQVVAGMRFWGVILGGVLLIITLVRYPGGLAEQGRELKHLGKHAWHERRKIGIALLHLPAALVRLAIKLIALPVKLWQHRTQVVGVIRMLPKIVPHIPEMHRAKKAAKAQATAEKLEDSVHHQVEATRPLELADLLYAATDGTNGERPPIELRRDLGRRRHRGPLLEVRDVSIRFGGVQALDAVSMEVRESEIVGLMGPNGAGKTTLFNCVTGFAKPNSGSVFVRGRDVGDLPPHARAALGFGRTFQNIGLVKTHTVLENLLIAQHLIASYGALEGLFNTTTTQRTEAYLRRRAYEILERLELGDVAHRVVKDLPHGILKVVEMGTALVTGPEILLLDEPSSGMGPQEADELGERLQAIRADFGVTIFMIEHHVPLVLSVADYVYVLNFGKLLAEGDARQVASDPKVVSAYLGEEVEVG